ncbi:MULTISPECIES: flagellar filament capping protein FliD [unclassified Pseudomonas]|uniref:flagellar filament capping protein FliD n=1 Tax=unclassified Pseudomonas TaxID=196821 RepID=UPI00129E7441|nr:MULTISPECIES: flagellar filament capping protein FliD [unclassified Pseudomonas]MDH4656353.1 A-type flagellar hook-associated protein 2 [Pseudomonas sp. BN606]MRK19555.1 A-type flagellar hook-associated protein 2 [Pseudomonas sp. JG-B]
MASTTISGINSGLDIQSIVSSLVAAEKAPKESQLARLERATTAKITGVGQLKSAIADLQSALKDLNKPELFSKRTATSSDSKLVSATTTQAALAGTYKIDVERLASSSKVATAAINGTSSTTFASGGTLTIKLGATDLAPVNIAANASLKDIRDAINTQLKDKGVTANIVTDSSTSPATSRLVLASAKTGDDANLGMTGTGDLAALDIAQYDPDSGIPPVANVHLSVAANARFSIDGLAMESASNSVADSIEGVTLNLVAPTEANKPITLTVDKDTAGVKANIQKFVDAYNKLISTTSSLTAVTKVGEDKAPVTGALVGDASVRTLLSSVRNELVKASGDGGIRILADLGITTQQDGTLKIDEAKLGKALTENYESVASFFTGDSGLMGRLNAKLDPYTQTGGVLEQRMTGLNGTMKSVDEQREALDRRVEQLQTRLLAQFNAMDSLVGQLNQTSSRMEQAFKSLPGLVKSS